VEIGGKGNWTTVWKKDQTPEKDRVAAASLLEGSLSARECLGLGTSGWKFWWLLEIKGGAGSPFVTRIRKKKNPLPADQLRAGTLHILQEPKGSTDLDVKGRSR